MGRDLLMHCLFPLQQAWWWLLTVRRLLLLPPVDPAKAAAEAQAEAIRLAQIEVLKQMNVIRRWSYRISTHEDFEMIVFIVIFANIVTLAMYNPLESDDHGYNFILDRIRKPGFLSTQPSLCATA